MKKLIFWLGIMLPGMVCLSCSRQLMLAKDGASKYVIVIPSRATETERKAAEEFQRLLALSTSAQLPVVTDSTAPRAHEILIGKTSRVQSAFSERDLKSDGFALRTEKKKLAINGGSEKGVLYGVYTFFDKYLGYRCYSSGVFNYPQLTEVVIEPVHDVEVPVNVYRNVYYEVANDPFYADWHKLDHMKPDWGMWVHTFAQLLPTDSFFTRHPEFYALVEGRRVGKQPDGHLDVQLCLTQPALVDTMALRLANRMKQNTKALYWSVSQNDTYADHPYNCTCPTCSALDTEEGSPSGSIIWFVNRIAERFPDKMISTLAYRYSRKPPKSIRPANNVNIMLCDIECNRHMPLEKDSASVGFRADFEGWGKIAKSIIMWDYIIQFSNLMSPFPNLRTLQPNMQYFVRNGVTAQFQQGNFSRGGEWSELRPYLVARLLWNPDADIKAELNDFLTGYYQEAAPFIAEYITLMHDELEKSEIPLSIYGKPMDHYEKGYLREDLLARYEALFDRAEEAVAAKPDLLERVQTARLPLMFAQFEVGKARGVKEDRMFEKMPQGWRLRPQAEAQLEKFRQHCEKTKVQHMVEGGLSPAEYCQQTRETLDRIVNDANKDL